MKIKSFIAMAATVLFAIVSFGCGGTATNTSNATANKPVNATSTTTTSSTTTTAPANAATTADSSSPNTGVAECDEYITKYEACLTTIASKAPQAAPALKTSFEQQRDAFKKAAATPQGKAALAPQCKTAMSTAKTATAQWCTNW